MSRFGFTVAAATALTGMALGLAGTAEAAPTGGGNAADTVNELRAGGYNIQINGSVSAPLSECTTTAVHGVPNAAGSTGPRSGPSTFTNVEVDVSCPVYD
jgi:hypothetical protein